MNTRTSQVLYHGFGLVQHITRTTLLIGSLLTIISCGQKGPLFYPAPPTEKTNAEQENGTTKNHTNRNYKNENHESNTAISSSR